MNDAPQGLRATTKNRDPLLRHLKDAASQSPSGPRLETGEPVAIPPRVEPVFKSSIHFISRVDRDLGASGTQ